MPFPLKSHSGRPRTASGFDPKRNDCHSSLLYGRPGGLRGRPRRHRLRRSRGARRRTVPRPPDPHCPATAVAAGRGGAAGARLLRCSSARSHRCRAAVRPRRAAVVERRAGARRRIDHDRPRGAAALAHMRRGALDGDLPAGRGAWRRRPDVGDNGFRVPLELRRWRPPRRTLRAMVCLCRAAIRLAQTRPAMAVDAGAARGLEQEVLQALVECLSAARPEPDPPARRREAALLMRLEDMLHAPVSPRSSASGLFASLGASERALRVCCRTHLGVGPRLYISLRRAGIAEQSGAP